MMNVDTEVAIADLASGQAVVSWEGSGGPKDEVSVGFVRMTYPALSDAGGASVFNCQMDAGGEVGWELTNYGAASAVVYDVVNGYRITVSDIQGGVLRVKLPAAGQNRVLWVLPVTDNGQEAAVENISIPMPAAGDADYIILTSRVLRTDGDPVQAYADYRASAAGGGYRTAVVNVEDLYAQFGYGVDYHPVAIRNFVAWQLRENPNFKYLFIIGKGREYTAIRSAANLSAALGNTFFVPSFGYPASDNLLVSRIDKPTPRVGIGRLPAISPAEVNIYLNKIRNMETAVANAPQTIAGKAWMKNILHLGGGSTASEQQSIRNNLENMAALAENGSFGAAVTGFYKTSTDPIQQSQSDAIFGRINEGVSILTFFGHSSAGTFDFNIDNPDNYQNVNKYPLMLSLGCYSGNMFDEFRSIGERFILLENGGAGVYGASRGLGFIHALSNFGRRFYELMSNDLYGQPVGDGIKAAIAHYENFTDQAYGSLMEQFSIHGDPAFRLNPSLKPDYVVDPSKVVFTPQIISTQKIVLQLPLT
ncbi:MAG: C25 family cysteine peptidase [Saprospiraceae bacterium]